MKFDVIGHKWIYIGFSATLVLVSLLAVIIFGFRAGIDFTGGTLWQFQASGADVSEQSISDLLQSQGIEHPFVYRELSSDSFIAKMPPLTEEEHQALLANLRGSYESVEELRFESIGPTIGAQLQNSAIWAGILILLAISIYVSISFRKVSYPVASWKYGVTTLITLFHDIAIPTGLLAILGKFYGIEVDTNFIVALLVTMGFSVHDTIVVFDRIRENVLLRRPGDAFEKTVNDSIQQTIARSINTSLTLVLMLLALMFIGPSSLRLFVAIMITGAVFGTYSSIFIASPLLTIWHKLSKVS